MLFLVYLYTEQILETSETIYWFKTDKISNHFKAKILLHEKFF